MNSSPYLKDIDFKEPPKLNFLKRLTNQTGIIQHTKYAVPDRNMGYSVDDNARALLVAVFYYKLFGDDELLDLAVIYLSFLDHAKTPDNWFYNFQTFDNKFLGHAKTEDGFGRVMWALGYTVFANPRRDLTMGALNLIREVKDNIKKLNAPRAKAYCLAGLLYLSQIDEGGEWLDEIEDLADDLVNLYRKYSDKNWKWFENSLTYANGIFPYALTLAYDALGKEEYLVIAKESLDFLNKETTGSKGIPMPIGQDGWYVKGKKKAIFDQQPLEAADMTLAFIALYKVTLDEAYLMEAKNWFAWYHGNNVHQIEVYDSVTHGCFDGIKKEGVNLNQGAESILTYLIAYLDFSDIELKISEEI